MSSSSNENEFIQLFTLEWHGNEDNQEGGIANIYIHPETTNTQTAFSPALPHPSFPYSDYSQVQWIMSLTLVVTMQRQSMFIRQKRSSQYIVRFINTYLIPEGKMWEDGKRWRTEEVRITREREGEERGRKHAHALLCKGEKPQRTDITACGPLSRIEMPPPHRWRQSEFFTPSQSTAHVIV